MLQWNHWKIISFKIYYKDDSMVLNKRNDILKIIAITTMLIDHIGVLFFPDILVFRTIGRIAFPIFAYFLATGFRYTSNRNAYAIRLLIVAVIAQLPYMFLNYQLEINYLGYNVLFLFVYGIGMLSIFDKMMHAKDQLENIKFQLYLLLLGFIIILPEILRIMIPGFFLSYGTYGLVLILLFYVFYNRSLWLLFIYPVFSFVFAYLEGVRVLVQFFDLAYLPTLFNIPMILNQILGSHNGILVLEGYFFQTRSILGLFVVLLFASFEYRMRLPRYFLYLFYPLHIIMLILIKTMI